MQMGPLLQPIVTIALSIVVPILSDYSILQAMLYSAGVAMIASNSISQKWRRKATKLNSMVTVVVLIVHSTLLAMLTASNIVSASIGLMIVWTMAAAAMLGITVMQITVNFMLLPHVFTRLPMRLYNVLHAEAQTK